MHVGDKSGHLRVLIERHDAEELEDGRSKGTGPLPRELLRT